MSTIDQPVDGYLRESEIDYIALPQLASAARWKLGPRTTEEARALTLQLVERPYERGLRPGDYNPRYPALIAGGTRAARQRLIVSNGNGLRPAKTPTSAGRSVGSPLAPAKSNRSSPRRPDSLRLVRHGDRAEGGGTCSQCRGRPRSWGARSRRIARLKFRGRFCWGSKKTVLHRP